MVWGVHCVHTTDITSFTDMVEKASRIALAEGFAKPGDRMVITAGVPFGRAGTTNILRIVQVGEAGGEPIPGD
jgi:pyruvate kinase